MNRVNKVDRIKIWLEFEGSFSLPVFQKAVKEYPELSQHQARIEEEVEYLQDALEEYEDISCTFYMGIFDCYVTLYKEPEEPEEPEEELCTGMINLKIQRGDSVQK
jgi:hypothetical protein